ncbi:MAG: hypothetical protein CMM56_01025 [Rhodospirillaceae bacterium]|nr:hypothetical protein [Rhodospirillaceae bacterium]|tara:strand:- start:3124 stop:4008 length:885 start_codon:yes stop_codon:yes gene_type:complete
MKSFVEWVLARRYRLVILAILFVTAPLISFVSTSLMTLVTLSRGGQQGVTSALMTTFGASLLGWFWGFSLIEFSVVVGATLLSGVALGIALRWTGTLSLTFQGLVLFCIVGTLLAGFLWSEPAALMAPVIDQAADWLRSSGTPEVQIANIIEGWDRLFIGFITLGIFLQLMVPLLLGSWWAAILNVQSQFGQQFRQLRMGSFLGIPGTLFMAASLVFDGPIIQNLFPLILIGFWFQGISVVHAWGEARQWNRGLMAAMYVLLIPPFTGVTIFALASVGLLDNWINLRAHLHVKV